MENINQKYIDTIKEFQKEVDNVDKKSQKAMRITLWLNIIIAVAGIGAVGAWLSDKGVKELWAMIIIFSKVADVMIDTLPFSEQRIKLPQLKLKLVDIVMEMERDQLSFERGNITEDEAINKFYDHRNAWIKSLS